jgi:hypothetical protein
LSTAQEELDEDVDVVEPDGDEVVDGELAGAGEELDDFSEVDLPVGVSDFAGSVAEAELFRASLR